MVRQQINIKLPPELIEALREKASTEEVTLTELIQGYCEQGLGLPTSNHQPVDTALIYERILTELDSRISTQLDIRIPELEEPLLTQLEERIAFIVDARISSQIALLEQRMATQLEEQTRDRQENYKQWFNEACKLGRELERSKQQSPYPTELAIESAIESVVEDALVSSSDDVSEPTATSNTDTSPTHHREGITATALAKRLGLKAVSSVTRRPKGESEEEFRDWSRKLNLDNIAWEPVPDTGTSKQNPKRYRKVSAVSS